MARPDSSKNMSRKTRGSYLRSWAISVMATISLLILGCETRATAVPTPRLETSEPVSFVTEDGLELRGRLFGEGKSGVVLVHMFHDDQASWWEFAELLADQGYMTLTFDFRGYGDSSGDKDMIEFMDRDVKAALGFLEGRGASKVVLVGASMGGTASLAVAADRTVHGVVSLSAPVEFLDLSVKEKQVRVPVLLMSTDGDRSAKKNLREMIEMGVVGGPELTASVMYEGGTDHGTDILKGDHGPEATARILGFLAEHNP